MQQTDFEKLLADTLAAQGRSPRTQDAAHDLDFTGATMRDFVTRNVTVGTTVYTDGFKSFEGLTAAGYKHVPRTQPIRVRLRQGAKSVVPLADRMIGNLQSWLVGTHHGVSRAQLQVYLDEFVFRTNRRREPRAAFQTLLGLGSGHAPASYEQVRHGGAAPAR